MTIITQNSSKQYVPEIENALEQKFEMESILANVPLTEHPILKKFFNSELDLKREKRELKAQIEELQNENNRLQKEISNEDKARARLSDRNDYLAQSSLASGVGGLVSFLWLCKDICNVSKIDLALFFLILATFGAFWVFVSSLLAFWHNGKQMNKIQKDYQVDQATDSPQDRSVL